MKEEPLRDILDWTDGTKEYENNLLMKACAFQEIVIFGAGIGGKMTLELLRKHRAGEKVKAFCDNNPEKVGRSYIGLPVISDMDIRDRFIDALVIVSSTAYDQIKKQLMNLQIEESHMYYFQPAGVSLEDDQDIMHVRKNMEKFEAVYDALADEKSKRIFQYLLNYRISKSISWLEKMEPLIDKEEDQYFDCGILKDYVFKDGFVDAGAYIGDTIASFYRHYPGWEGYCYCLEAGKDNYMEMCRNIEAMDQKGKIVPFQIALWDQEEKLRFDTTNGNGSRVSDQEGEPVSASSLDKLLNGKEISFIKMDIEGAEKKAILGAKEVIRRCRPILVVCIYHRPEDFFEIPMVITDITGDEYTFYVRQYRFGQSETVLYGMPKSRKCL